MYIYGVFHGTKWALTHSKRRAIVYARRNNAMVGRLRGDGPWDAPTFKALCTPIADFSLRTYQIVFAPEGRVVDIISAQCARQARRMFYRSSVGQPFKRAKGEIYLKEM